MDKLLVFLCFLLLFIIFTFPLILNLNEYILGNLYGLDLGGEFWLHWWVNKALFNKDLSLFYTNHLEYPIGENVLLDVGNFLNPILNIPLYKMFGAITSFNLYLLIMMALNGFCMYLLLNYIIKNKIIAFIVSIIFAFNPFILNQIPRGKYEQIVFLWVILFILFILKLKTVPILKYAIFSAIFFVLTTLSSWHYGIILTVFFIIFIPYYFYHNKYKRVSFKKLLLLIIIILLLLFPFIVQTHLHFCNTNYPIIIGNKDIKPEDFKNSNSGLPEGKEYIIATSFNPFIFSIEDNSTNIILLFILSMVIVPLFFIKKRSWFWINCFFTFFILSMGPFLRWRGVVTNVSLPYLFLYKYFPLFSRFFWTRRFLIFMYLCGSIAIGCNIQQITFKLSKVKKTIFICLLTLIIPTLIIFYCLNKFGIPLVPQSKIYVPEVYRKLATSNEDFAIIKIPFFPNSHYYMFLQTVHDKKMMNTSRGVHVKYLMSKKSRNFIGQFLHNNKFRIKNDTQKNLLKKLNFRYIIVYPELTSHESLKNLKQKLGTPIEEDGLCIFKLEN